MATVIAALAFVGKTLITQITNDLYKWGVTKFCKSKWSKKYKSIKNACEDLGYALKKVRLTVALQPRISGIIRLD